MTTLSMNMYGLVQVESKVTYNWIHKIIVTNSQS